MASIFTRLFLLGAALAAHAAAGASVLPRGDKGGFLSLEQIDAAIAALHEAAPNLTRVQLLGTSFQGRNITAICAGRCWSEGTVPSLLITGLFHAREPVGMMAALAFLDELLAPRSLATAQTAALLARRAVWVVPVVNPDGYAANLAHWGQRLDHLMVRKNRRKACGTASITDFGVDLNRNFDYYFTFDNEGSSPQACAEDYRGSSAFSEPESAAIRDLVLRQRFGVALNWHSFGRFINLPYAVRAVGSPPAPIYDTFLNLASGFSNLTGFGYGHPYDGGLYSVNGEASDWMLSVAGTYAMSPELGPFMEHSFETGMWPPEMELPGLVHDAVLISERAAWVSGPLLELSLHSLSSPVGDCGPGCSQLALDLRLRNNGVRDSEGAVVVTLVDALAEPASAQLCPGGGGGPAAAPCTGRWRDVGLPLCGADSTPPPSGTSPLLSCPAIADAASAGLLGAEAGRRGLSDQGDDGAPFIVSSRRSLSRTVRLMELAEAMRKRDAPAAALSSAAAAARDTQAAAESANMLMTRRRLDIRVVAAELDSQETAAGLGAGGGSGGAGSRALPEGGGTPAMLLGADVSVATMPASAVNLAAWDGVGVLPAQNETVPLRLVLRSSAGVFSSAGFQSACRARAQDSAHLACDAGVPAPTDATMAFLGVSDATTCSIYSVSCGGDVALVHRGQSGCAPCALFRSTEWGPSPAQPPPSLTPSPPPPAVTPSASGTGAPSPTASPSAAASAAAASGVTTASATSPPTPSGVPPSPASSVAGEAIAGNSVANEHTLAAGASEKHVVSLMGTNASWAEHEPYSWGMPLLLPGLVVIAFAGAAVLQLRRGPSTAVPSAPLPRPTSAYSGGVLRAGLRRGGRRPPQSDAMPVVTATSV